MDGTAIIAEEDKVPAFDPAKDYSQWPAGAPVRDGEQVYKLITPHNAAHYPDSRPSNTPALWSITHTKRPGQGQALDASQRYQRPLRQGRVLHRPGGGRPRRRLPLQGGQQRIFPGAYPQNWELVE